MHTKRALAALFAAMLLTGCGNDALPQAEGSSAAETAVTSPFVPAAAEVPDIAPTSPLWRSLVLAAGLTAVQKGFTQ